MKKFVSVALATAMIASLGVTAFAKSDYDADVKKVDFIGLTNNGTVDGTADELYFPLTVKDKETNEICLISDSARDVKGIREAAAKEAADWQAIVDEYKLVNAAALVSATWDTDARTSLDNLKTEIEKVVKTNEPMAELATAGKDGGWYYNDKKIVKNVTDKAIQISWTDYVEKVVEQYANEVSRLNDQIKDKNDLVAALRGYDRSIAYDEIEDIDDLKMSLKLTAGEDYVADYYIDEIDNGDGFALDGYYAMIIELNDNYTTKKQKIKGTVTLKNTTRKLNDKDFSFNHHIIQLTVDKNHKPQVDGIDGGECEFDDEDVYLNLVDFNSEYNVAKFTKDVKNIELEDNSGFYFETKASDQGKLNLTYDNVAIKSVTRVAPADADLSFYNFYGYPEFDFTGTVTITPEEDDVEYFIYKVAKDGKISKVNAKLNEDGDAYEFKTRTLGCYVLSDMELDIDEVNAGETTPEDKPADGEGTPAPEAGKPNPGTGL